MDTNRFDRAIRSLHDGAPRRQVLGVLLGGALGIAGLAEGEAKRKKKVTLCLNGQTMAVKKSKQGSLLSQGATKGACPNSPPPPTCPTTQKLCNGRCIDKAKCCTDADCDACKVRSCQNETCECKPDTVADAQGFCGPGFGAGCLPVGTPTPTPGLCCSQAGDLIQANPPIFLCVAGNAFCKTSADCVGNAACRGFMCPPIYAQVAGAQCGNA